MILHMELNSGIEKEIKMKTWSDYLAESKEFQAPTDWGKYNLFEDMTDEEFQEYCEFEPRGLTEAMKLEDEPTKNWVEKFFKPMLVKGASMLKPEAVEELGKRVKRWKPEDIDKNAKKYEGELKSFFKQNVKTKEDLKESVSQEEMEEMLLDEGFAAKIGAAIGSFVSGLGAIGAFAVAKFASSLVGTAALAWLNGIFTGLLLKGILIFGGIAVGSMLLAIAAALYMIAKKQK